MSPRFNTPRNLPRIRCDVNRDHTFHCLEVLGHRSAIHVSGDRHRNDIERDTDGAHRSQVLGGVLVGQGSSRRRHDQPKWKFVAIRLTLMIFPIFPVLS